MSSYDKFAQKYSDSMGEEGDYFHKKYIDPAVYELVGNVKGKTVYDIGCGNGYMARHFINKGADKVYASDSSKKLIEIAKDKSEGLGINYTKHDAIDFSGFEEEQFDVVVMNMVIHYIDDLENLFSGIFRTLKSDGSFVFSTNHFFRPTYPYSEWTDGKVYGERKIFIKVTGYLESRKVKIDDYWGQELEIINRPLNVFIDKLSKKGLYISKVIEPDTPDFPRSTLQELEHDHHIPTFLIAKAEKIHQ